MERMQEILNKMSMEFPGFLAGAIVDKHEGLTIVESRKDEDFEISITAAYSVELVRAQKRSLEALGAEDEDPIEIFAFTKSYIFISKPLGDTPFYLHLVLKRSKAVLGLVFAFLKKYDRLLTEAARQWQEA
ncbi:MAG: hypothetical protein GXO29_02870 [Thermotogae bacterium]|nr:hypothetical protein [Thermotogota bacterium]